jgi:hypothetical protein
MEVSASRIAKDLSTAEKPVHRSTVGRALKALDEKGFVDMELLKVRTGATGTVLALDQQMALERRKQEDGASAVFESDVKQSDRPTPKSCACGKGACGVPECEKIKQVATTN